MQTLKVFFYILEWKIPNGSDLDNLFSALLSRYETIRLYFALKYGDLYHSLSLRCERMYSAIEEQFGLEGIFLIGLFALLILLIVIIHIKSLFEIFSIPQKEQEANDETFVELEAEKELSLNLIEASVSSDDFLGLHEDYERLKQMMQSHAEKEQKSFEVWQNKQNNKGIPEQKRYIREQISLIVKMMARQVSEAKIAQVLSLRINPKLSQNVILQNIRTIRNFAGLASSGVFSSLPSAKTKPSPSEALHNLCEKGDNSLCLELLQTLTAKYVEDAMQQEGITRQVLLSQAAGYACLTGAFAAFDDAELAQKSYIFATELAPESVNAWCMLGQSYSQQGSDEKASFAYRSVMELADDPYLFKEQIALAKQGLVEYCKNQGMSDKAKDYATSSSRYMAKFGFGLPLSPLEEAAADHIIARQDISESLEILLAEF